MAVLWNDVKVLNTTTGLYEAYLLRAKLTTPSPNFPTCQNIDPVAPDGWVGCYFIAKGSFDSGKMLDGYNLLTGQYFGANSGCHIGCWEVLRVIDEYEFNNGQMQCPNGYFPPSPVQSNVLYPNGHIVDYDTLEMFDYGSVLFPCSTGPAALTELGTNHLGNDMITYCCKECTNWSPYFPGQSLCVGGCTDPLALNYDSTQTIDDGSCIYDGCMDILAVNYNSQAVWDDGSCVYAGCTDPLASNYDPNVTIDDGSCACIKCCENIDAFGNISHMLLNSTTTPCQCPSGWYDVICGQYLGWECDPSTSSCVLVPNGAYSSQTECDLDCRDCGCTKLLGTGHTSAYAIALSADCEEYCCDPDLKDCCIFVVGDDEGIQVYDPTNNNTSHLFDSNFADILDIAAVRSGNDGFIWVYKINDAGTEATILEYKIQMVPFTQSFVRYITLTNMVVGKGMTYFGHDPITGEVILTLGAGTGSIQNYTLPIGIVDTTIGTVSYAYGLPSGYKITGDLLTEGRYATNPLDCVLYDNNVTYKVGIIARNTGTVLEEHTISSAIMTGTTKFEGLFVDTTLGFPGKIMGVTTDGRIYELLQSGPGGAIVNTLQFAATSTGQIDFINNVTNTVYGADNLSRNNELCSRGAILMPDSYDCVVSNWGCTDPGTGLGQYSSLTQCESFCIVSANCKPGQATGNCKIMDAHPDGYLINNWWVDGMGKALQWISISTNGLDQTNFHIIGWPNVQSPSTMQGVCWMKWYPGATPATFQQKWKIKHIKCGVIHPTSPFNTWKAFITYAAIVTGNNTVFSSSNNYYSVQAWLYGTYGFGPGSQIKIYAEPCICWGWPCECVPVLGTSGTYNAGPTTQDNLDACIAAPCCPCVQCCRKNGPPYNTYWLPTLTNPCVCPAGWSAANCLTPVPKDDDIAALASPSVQCKKTCTNGSYYMTLKLDDEYCDCNTYGLDEAPPECDKCCTDGTINKKLPLYSTICECDTGWYECSTTPTCEKVCISTSNETTKRLHKPEWPECDCPAGYQLYVDEVVNTTVTSSDSIICSRCIGGEVETKTFGSEVCPGGWTLSMSFNASDCVTTTTTTTTTTETPPLYVTDYPIYEDVPTEVGDRDISRYGCGVAINSLVGETQHSCMPKEDGEFATIEACLYEGCGGFMSCKEEMSIDGVIFGEDTYDPIVMCCESVINTSYERLTTDYCTAACGDGETWYPLYNAFGPNTIHDSLLSYMTRELLDPVRNGGCKVGAESTFTSQGLTRVN